MQLTAPMAAAVAALMSAAALFDDMKPTNFANSLSTKDAARALKATWDYYYKSCYDYTYNYTSYKKTSYYCTSSDYTASTSYSSSYSYSYDSSDYGSSSNSGGSIGGSIGGSLCCLVIIIAIICCCCKRRQ